PPAFPLPNTAIFQKRIGLGPYAEFRIGIGVDRFSQPMPSALPPGHKPPIAGLQSVRWSTHRGPVRIAEQKAINRHARIEAQLQLAARKGRRTAFTE
ncbi:MAG: hypothetical protein ACTJGO_12175, partial [Glutamicibacter arilaitensis]|uniref:hypothetical protein n=1 Tax=Glutamicibacter arilaitensis TaxID=256701 RepID=UPI003FD572E5